MREAHVEKKQRMSAEPGRVFRAWSACSECDGEVGAHDGYCRHCGVRFGPRVVSTTETRKAL